jgi:hypothetical protein
VSPTPPRFVRLRCSMWEKHAPGDGKLISEQSGSRPYRDPLRVDCKPPFLGHFPGSMGLCIRTLWMKIVVARAGWCQPLRDDRGLCCNERSFWRRSSAIRRMLRTKRPRRPRQTHTAYSNSGTPWPLNVKPRPPTKAIHGRRHSADVRPGYRLGSTGTTALPWQPC